MTRERSRHPLRSAADLYFPDKVAMAARADMGHAIE